MWTHRCPRPIDTALAGRALAESTAGPLLVELVGDLGAGKTCFAQGVGEGLGVRDPVVSPTFILMAEYAGWRPLLHIDAWRIDAEEAEEIGLSEAVAGWEGIALVEWADRVSGHLPADRLRVELMEEEGGSRLLRVRASGHQADEAALRWRRALGA